MSSQPERPGFFRRIKMMLMTVTGLLSGAAMMYVSPLVDRVVKPSRPLANFAVETDGLQVTLHNRFAGEGWWDFGDGTPLEPARPQQATVTHDYAKPGTYTIKLMVRNFVGEEHERTVSVEATPATSTAGVPSILSLEAVPLSAVSTAPATFRLIAQVTNADRCIWDLGVDQPLEMADSTTKIERFVTLPVPGTHFVQLLAMNGGQAVKRAVAIQVHPAPANTLVAMLRVTDSGLRTEKSHATETLPVHLTRARGTQSFERTINARTGFTISDAKLGNLIPAFRNVKLAVAPDGKSIKVTGEVTPTDEMRSAAFPPTIPVQISQEKKWKSSRGPSEVMASVAVPGAALLPMPAANTASTTERQMIVELRDNGRVIWQETVPGRGGTMTWQNRPYSVRATPTGSQIRLELTPSSGVVPASIRN